MNNLKATDLRIGNWVLNPNNSECSQITAMDISDIQSGIKVRQGILLTEDLLLKCGFQTDDEEWLHITFQLDDGNESYGIRFNGNFWEYYMFDLTKIYFLHELQNLIYSLTCEELTIKENE